MSWMNGLSIYAVIRDFLNKLYASTISDYSEWSRELVVVAACRRRRVHRSHVNRIDALRQMAHRREARSGLCAVATAQVAVHKQLIWLDGRRSWKGD